MRPHSTHKHIPSPQTALAAALSDTACLPLHLCSLCTAGKISLPEPRPAPCLDVDLGLSFISSHVKSYLEAEARSSQVPAAASPQTHLDSRGPLLCSAWGTWSSPRPPAIAHILLHMWRQGALPFTPSPSQHSLPFPAFSFPLSFLLPFSGLSQHLHVLLLLLKLSPFSPEVSWRAALAVGVWQEEGLSAGPWWA